MFAPDSTTISLSIELFTWAHGKYSRGAVKVHTLLDLRGSIPEFILVTDGKWHDSNALDIIEFQCDAIYVMDRGHVDFEALYRIERVGVFFVTRARHNMRFEVIEQNFNVEQSTGLRSDRSIRPTGVKSNRLYPEKLRLTEISTYLIVLHQAHTAMRTVDLRNDVDNSRAHSG